MVWKSTGSRLPSLTFSLAWVLLFHFWLSSVLDVAVVQLLSHAQLFATPWTAARQASLSFTVSWSLLRLTSIESMMPSNHLILCHPLLLLVFLRIRGFSSELLLSSGGQRITLLLVPNNQQSHQPKGELLRLFSITALKTRKRVPPKT